MKGAINGGNIMVMGCIKVSVFLMLVIFLQSADFASGQPTNHFILPSNGQEAGAFHMAVIGDSIAWGNGLEDENKSFYLVADWLQRKLNRAVDVTIYAHSGAAISGGSGNAIDPNLNSKFPSLMDQANSIQNKGDVDLILVSGGINDVGINNILDANTPADTINSLSESIRVPMTNLLSYLLNETNAKIMVIGYYPLITEDSKVEIQDRAVASLLATTSEKTVSQSENVLISALSDPTAAKVQAAWYLLDGLINNAANILTKDASLRANSDTFYAISSNSLNIAVKNADRDRNRAIFIDPLFGRKNAYHASDSMLWHLNKDLKTNDDEYNKRVELTKSMWNPTTKAENNINAIAHPNRNGSIKYAHAIEFFIEKSKGLDWLISDSYLYDITIFNSAGTRVANTEVVIDNYSARTTDSQGKLVVFISDGNHSINASKPGYGVYNWSGFINHSLMNRINITLKPIPKHLFTITTLNSAKFPIEGTEVKVNGIFRGYSGPDGNLSIELVNDKYNVEASKQGYGAGNWTGILDNRTNSTVRVILNGALEYPFEITTFNSAGYPMEGTNVSIDGLEMGITNQYGKITSMLVEGNHSIEAIRANYGSRDWTGILNYSESRNVDIWLNGPLEYPFNVSVINAADYSIKGALISLAGINKGTTDKAGSLKAFLPEGNQTIQAIKDGYGSANWTGWLNHTDAKDIEIRINGAMEYPFNITVINSAGNMIQGADVRADGKTIGFTDINGILEAMLTEGYHFIAANKTGYDQGNWTGELNHSDGVSPTIVLGGSSLIMDMQPIDLCLVLDASGSMADPECKDLSKIQAVKNAAQDTIAAFFFPGTSSRVAIVSFSHFSSTEQEFTNNFQLAYENVSHLSPWGATSFGMGLSQAVEEFKKLNQTGHVREIIFMSDGMHNTPPEYGYYLALCRIMGIRVYTVGYGAEADHDLLKQMAILSGGEYAFADPCGDNQSGIGHMFMRQQMNLSGSVPTIIASGEVLQNQTVNATYFIVPPGSKYPTITLSYPGTHLKLNLIGPNGMAADPKEYVYVDYGRTVSVRLKDPEPGNWIVQVIGDQVNGTEPYTVYVSPEYKAPTIPDLSIKSIHIKETSGETLIEHPVQIVFNPKNFPSQTKDGGSDINIFDQNGREIPRWIEEWDREGKKGSIWIKVPEIPADGELELLLLTGNPGVLAENNGSNIFPFFDDFEDGSIDPNKWSISSSPSARIEEANGTLHIYADEKSNSSADLSSIEAFSPDVALRFRANVSKGQGSDYKGLGFLEGNIGKSQGKESMKEGVYWFGQEKNLFLRHNYSAIGRSTQASDYRQFESKYESKYRTWQIKWINSSIEYYLDGSLKSPPPETVAIPEQPMNIGFSINTTYQAYPSEILLDWVLAYIPAKTGPAVTIEKE